MTSLVPSTAIKLNYIQAGGKKNRKSSASGAEMPIWIAFSAHLLPKPPAEFKVLESCIDLCM